MIAIRRPAGPKNPPILGQIVAFRSDPLGFLKRTVDKYGDVAYYRLGPLDAFLVNEPELIRRVLVTNQNNFTKSRALQRAKAMLGEGLLTSEGDFHLRQRRLVQPAFHRPRLIGYAQVMTDCALRTRERWHAGEVLDVSSEMMRLTLAVVGKTLFSADVEAEAAAIGEALTAILKMFDFLMMPFSEYLEKLPLPAVRRFEKGRARLDQTIFGIIAERRRSGEDCGDLLSMLLLAQDEDGGGGMSDRQVRDEALTLFLAGHETTAQALTWSWYLLSQNPECERKMHEEIQRVLGDREPSFEDLPQLRYTEMVLAESMRLYPPAWGVGRKAIEACEIGGYELPKGGVVIMSPYVMHRDPRWFPEPDRFDPERWIPEARDARPKFSYFPFGGGSRLCIGERFAWMEGTLMLATIAQKWRLRLVPGHRVEPLPLITLRSKYGMRMRVESVA